MRLRKKIITILLLMVVPLGLLGCSFDPNKLLEGKNPISDSEQTNDTDIKPNDEVQTNATDNNVEIKDEEKDNGQTNEAQPVKEKKNYRVYYYDIDYNIYYFDKEVELIDKGVIKSLTKELTIAPNETLKSTLPSGIEVRTAKVEDGILTVEFGKDFYEKVKLGSGSESSMIQCIVNTYGYNLGVNNVIIKVDGKNYSSGHIALEEGKSFVVDYSKAKQGK